MSLLIVLAALAFLMFVAYRGYSVILFAPIAALGAVLLTDPSLVEGGKVTAKGITLLKERMPHLTLGAWESDPQVTKVGELFTVKSLVDFVERKLKG